MSHSYLDLPRPMVLGHRGAAGLAPENTLLAFERGLELGADILETDCHVTRDGIPVLIHDAEVDRITNGSGAVCDLTFEALRELDAGYRFGPGRSHEDAHGPPFPERGQGHRIPSVREAFEAFPNARFNIEIKSRASGLVDALLDLVREFEREETTLLAAGDDAIMLEVRDALKARATRPAIGASLADIVGVVHSAVRGESPPPDIDALQIPPDFAGKPLVTEALVAHAHAHEIQIHVWTINDPDEIRDLLGRGVDGIVTDFPQRVAEIAGR